jgi:hypothetical protein
MRDEIEVIEEYIGRRSGQLPNTATAHLKYLLARLEASEAALAEYAKIDGKHWQVAGTYNGESYLILWAGAEDGPVLAQRYFEKWEPRKKEVVNG